MCSLEQFIDENDKILREYHAKQFPEIFDDDLADHYDLWTENLTKSEILDIVKYCKGHR